MELAPDLRLVIATLAGGGSERVCVALANHWAQEARRVEILLVRREGPFLDSLDPRVRILAADVPRVRNALTWFRRELNRLPKVPALLFGFDFGVSLAGMKRFGLLSAPLVYREGSCPLANIGPYSHWKYRAFVAGANGLIAQSETAMVKLSRLGVRPPVAQVIWNPLPLRPAVVRRNPEINPPGPIRLLAVGRLSPEKGYLRLLDAVAKLHARGAGATLTIVGEGMHRKEIERCIRDRGLESVVNLAGFDPEPSRLFNEVDCFVLPSYYEGQPNALLEAIQAGCRIVAAGGSGVRELLERLDLECCWIAEDNGDFGAGLEMALDRSMRLPEAAWHGARAELGRRTAIQEVAAAYRTVLEECAG